MPRYFNTTNGPVVYDADGRIFGGNEWLETEETEHLLRAISYGQVIELPPLEEPEEEPKRRRRSRKTEEPKTEETSE